VQDCLISAVVPDKQVKSVWLGEYIGSVHNSVE
jgi:hypothetical protein